MSEEWILLDNMAVRVGDISRIHLDMRLMVFTVTFRDGATTRLPMDAVGGDWCLKIMEVGRKTAAAAKAAFDGEEGDS